MSKLKRFASMILALVLALGLSTTAFAASPTPTYTITINSAANDETYSAYKVFDVTYSGENYSYTIDGSSAFYSVVAGATDYFTLTQVSGTNTYVVTLADIPETGGGTRTATADEILSVLSTANLSTTTADSSAVAASNTATINLNEAGYYYVTTTLGSVVMLDNAAPTATIEDKNGEPTVDKVVTEDSDNSTGKTNDADVGDTVTFTSTITDIEGAKNLVLHDTMTDLTFVAVTSVTLDGTAMTSGSDYIVNRTPTDGCTFEITFLKDFTNVSSTSSIVVTYTATVNVSAVTETGINSTYVSYGDASKSTTITTTYTYGIEIFKYTGTNTPLDNAKFALSKIVSGITYYAVVESGVLTKWTPTEGEATTLVSGSDGKILINGLDADTYYLTETEAPTGYNKLTSPITVTITGTEDSSTGELTGAYTVKVSSGSVTSGNMINVQNNTGSSLPTTGGIGTTIFYVVGGVLVFGAVVLLITRKRMNKAE